MNSRFNRPSGQGVSVTTQTDAQVPHHGGTGLTQTFGGLLRRQQIHTPDGCGEEVALKQRKSLAPGANVDRRNRVQDRDPLGYRPMPKEVISPTRILDLAQSLRSDPPPFGDDRSGVSQGDSPPLVPDRCAAERGSPPGEPSWQRANRGDPPPFGGDRSSVSTEGPRHFVRDHLRSMGTRSERRRMISFVRGSPSRGSPRRWSPTRGSPARGRMSTRDGPKTCRLPSSGKFEVSEFEGY